MLKFLALIFFLAGSSLSQVVNVMNSSVAWGDYDNDGDLDFLITGWDGNQSVSKIYRNDAGTFVDISAGLTGVSNGSATWGDYDNDGDLDILLTGDYVAEVYRNDGGIFTNINANLIGVDFSSAAWGDYDNDGDLDILLTGLDVGANPVTKLYRNDDGIFNEVTGTGFVNVYEGSVDWGDYDNDGDLDILLTGYDSGGNPVTVIYRNDDSVFVKISTGLINVGYSSVAWGDYDNDGDLDILLTGMDSQGIPVTKVYRNDAGIFTDITPAGTLPGVARGSVDWGDYDNDGDLDILLTGSDGISYISKLFRNDGADLFTEVVTAMEGVEEGSVDWGDYDNDGDLDILLSGEDNFGSPFTAIYINDIATVANTVPTAPSGLQASVMGRTVELRWTAGTDVETMTDALTYNIRIGTSPGASDILSPMSLSDGTRLIPEPGNAGHNTFWIIDDLDPGTYYWSVQTVDNAFAGSPFAPEQSFTIYPDPYELNNDTANAYLISYGFTSSGSMIDKTSDVDYFKFDAITGDFVKIEVTTDTLDCAVWLFNSNGDILAMVDRVYLGTERILYGIPVTGTYYIVVTYYGTTPTFADIVPDISFSFSSDDLSKSGKDSPFSAGISETFQQDTAGSYTLTLTLGEPIPPINVIAGDGFESAVPIRWSPPLANLPNYYNVYRSTSQTGPWTFIGSTYRTDFVDTTAVNGTTYYYGVSAVFPATDSESVISTPPVSGTPSAGGYQLVLSRMKIGVTLDGSINSSEWSDANVFDITIPGRRGVKLYIKSDGKFLYIAVDDSNGVSPTFNQIGIYFDRNNNGIWDISPSSEGNFWIDDSAGTVRIRFREISGSYPNINIGTIISDPKGVDASFSYATGHIQYEVSIDLKNSILSASPGDTIGLYIFSFASGFTGEIPSKAIYAAPITFADVVLPSLPPLSTPKLALFISPPVYVGKTRSFKLKVYNNTDTSIAITSVILGDTVFRYTGGVPVDIPGRDSVLLDFTFTPPHSGIFVDTLRIISDVPDTLGVIFAGMGVRPPILSSRESVNFGMIALSDSAKRSIFVHNIGEIDTVRITSVEVDRPFAARIFIKRVPPGDSVRIFLGFKPEIGGTHIDTLFVISNAWNDTLRVELRGVGLPVLTSLFRKFQKDTLKFIYRAKTIDTLDLSLFEYSVDGGKTWRKTSNVSGNITKIFGVRVDTIYWDTRGDLPNFEGYVKVRITFTSRRGYSVVSAFDSVGVDNLPPRFAGVEFAVGDTASVHLSWRRANDINRPIRYLVFYSDKSGGQNFAFPNKVVVVDTFTTISGLTNFKKYYFVVRAVDRLGNVDRNTVEISAVPSVRATADIQMVLEGKKLSGDIKIPYVVTGADGDSVYVKLYYSVDGGTNWIEAQNFISDTLVLTNLTAADTLIWRSDEDVALETNNAVIRLTPIGRGGPGIEDTSGIFTLDNQAPKFGGLAQVQFIPWNKIKLRWKKAMDISAPVKYLIYIGKDGPVDLSVPEYETIADSITITGIEGSTVYRFIVRAVDLLGNADVNEVTKEIKRAIGDFDGDNSIATYDLAQFVKAWTDGNILLADLYPYQGTFPKIKVIGDKQLTVRDLYVFIKMWNYSHIQGLPKIDDGIIFSGDLIRKRIKVQEGKDILNFSFVPEIETRLIAIGLNISYDPEIFEFDSIGIKYDGISLVYNDSSNGMLYVDYARLGGFEGVEKFIEAKLKLRSFDDSLIVRVVGYDLGLRKVVERVYIYSFVEVPDKYALYQNYPNPFNPVTTIRFDLPEDGHVELVVYDILGRKVRTLLNEFKEAGSYKIRFDAGDLASGIYFYKLRVNSFSAVRKMVLVK
jgi:hypothetical protein